MAGVSLPETFPSARQNRCQPIGAAGRPSYRDAAGFVHLVRGRRSPARVYSTACVNTHLFTY
ncbi:hypothetical protein GGTG_01485 [Gaeumannomyces tritici R3-111a-1]|uniref:Uncharacterized protein n=1 Tax=Gaeumannomyces tritici (strain R3-111a-1) TaxID=644352 RepID=J3NJQ5_GAET3|nr:hypothetical protein GGTG_01485 [Gaeumannomyces tritici R3-111a-1]EJT81507.1 hypothetical protein GGTG_01485 [Gaeumannomyces tritici R3-111a-1]